MLAVQGGILGGHKSAPVLHKHMLSHPSFSSPLINEDLPSGTQLVFTLNNRFFRHQACYSLLPAKPGGQADRVVSLCKYKVVGTDSVVRSPSSERTPLCHARVKSSLKPVNRSLSRDHSYRLPYLIWQKLVVTLEIGDHFFLKVNWTLAKSFLGIQKWKIVCSVSVTHGQRNFKDTNPLMSSLLVIFAWGVEAIL